MFFTNIETPAGLRDAHMKLIDGIISCIWQEDQLMKVLRDGDASLSAALFDTAPWLKQVQSCLRPALFMAETVTKGASCLVHCDEGLDATCILVSLAKLFMDPYYRTFKGFLTLVDEDWLQGGFRFADRCGLPTQAGTPPSAAVKAVSNDWLSQSLSTIALDAISGGSSNSMSAISPVWTLFLDCVHQAHRQFPTEFEFTPSLLLCLHFHSTSCQFGLFQLGPIHGRNISGEFAPGTSGIYGENGVALVASARPPNAFSKSILHAAYV
jgi:hypothetical protein